MKHTGLFRLAGVTLITTVLAACASKPSTTPQSSTRADVVAPAPVESDSDPAEKVAMARQVWREQQDALLRDSYLIDAADAFLARGDKPQAQQIIYTLRKEGVSAQLQNELNFLTAAAFADENIAPAKLLPLVTNTQLGGKWQQRQLQLQRQLYLASNQYLRAANSQLMLDDPNPENIAEIWRWVNQATDAERDAASGQYPLVEPFLALHDLLERKGLNTTELQQALAQFRQVYRGHPIAENLNQLIQDPDTLYTPELDELVVLLPLSGRYEDTGNAVKQGILSAYYRQLQQPSEVTLPTLRFIDTSDKAPEAIVEELGTAQWVLGPLLKSTLDALLPVLPPRVSMLALNRSETQPLAAFDDTDVRQQPLALSAKPAANEAGTRSEDPQPNESSTAQTSAATSLLPTSETPSAQALFFALAPEDEAYQLADLIYEKGYRAPIVVSSQSSLYQRMNDAFSERWGQLNSGRVANKRVNLTQVRFSDSASLRDGITRALDVAQSNDRISQIKYMINEEVYNMPRNRQDIDAVVVFASPQNTELLNPMVEASLLPANNSRVPVYATSRSMDYDSGKNQWRDLQNVRFLDMPWMLPNHPWQSLDEQVSALWPNHLTQRRRLFAFGVDAYNLMPNLANLNAYPQTSADGLTGKLKLNRVGEIIRELPRAIINNGQIKTVTE